MKKALEAKSALCPMAQSISKNFYLLAAVCRKGNHGYKSATALQDNTLFFAISPDSDALPRLIEIKELMKSKTS